MEVVVRSKKFFSCCLISLLVLSFGVVFLSDDIYAEDYPDDLYTTDYSIKDMLENYSVVTFGQKDYDSKVTQLQGQTKGSLKIFHTVGNFIVKGDYIPTYNTNNYNQRYSPSHRIDCATVYQDKYSYVEGSFAQVIDRSYCNRTVYGNTYNRYANNSFTGGSLYLTRGKYINIERLYENITEEQSRIKKGKIVETNGDTLYLDVGGEYYIEDISGVRDILFNNFEDNKNELTVITIGNSGAIDFPQLFTKNQNNGSYQTLPSNDSVWKTKPESTYANNFVVSNYYGNIIWNIPNASYIKFRSGAPIVGHIIAPNADIEGPELHFAGGILANSLALPSNSEAHFYPLLMNIPFKEDNNSHKILNNIDEEKGNIVVDEDIDLNSVEEGLVVSFKVKTKGDCLLEGVILSGDNSNSIAYNKIGDDEFEFTMPASDVTIKPVFSGCDKHTDECIIPESKSEKTNIIKPNSADNPNTSDAILRITFIAVASLAAGVYIYKKNLKKIA